MYAILFVRDAVSELTSLCNVELALLSIVKFSFFVLLPSWQIKLCNTGEKYVDLGVFRQLRMRFRWRNSIRRHSASPLLLATRTKRPKHGWIKTYHPWINSAAAEMRMVVLGIALAVGAEMMIRTLRHQFRAATISPITFFGAVCFISAIANYVNKPIITYLSLYMHLYSPKRQQ